MRPRLVHLALIFAAVSGAFLTPCALSASSKDLKTITNRLQEYGSQARARLNPPFANSRISYPPQRLILVGLKAERVLQVYALSETNSPRFVRSYPILAASGGPGPKLREGDRQVPEGIYPIESLNPNSAYHLSLRIGYPNSFDRSPAAEEGRTNLGGDIMIHGKSVSIGCLAMGDQAAEDLFVLAADTGLQNIQVILSPVDFRTGASVPNATKLPDWTNALYSEIRARLAALPSEQPK
jgi:murein L,D-transpeptidase YafK